jgi:bacteriocin-like protein
MKFQELNQQELTEINGGGLFGNNNSQSGGSLLGSLGLGSLLSFSSETQDGDEHTKTSFSLLDGLNLDLGGIFQNQNS